MIGPLLPIPRGKKKPPYFEGWQLKSPAELEELFQKYPGCNPAVRLDTLVQIDADNEPAIKKVAEMKCAGILPPTLNYNTWRGVETPLYKARPGLTSFDITANGMKLQIRTGAGHYALIPDASFQGKDYRWAKHLGPADVDVADLPDAALQALSNAFKNANSSTYSSDFKTDFKTGRLDFSQGHRDNSLFTVANALTKQGMTEADIAQVLITLANNCDPPFPEKDVFSKILSAERRKNQRERSIAEEVRTWVLTSSGLYQTSDCFKELDLTSRDFKKAATLEMLRLKKAGIIESCGEKRGCYRRIERESTELDFLSADTGSPLPIKWPFELEKLVDIYPKNLVMVAGSKDAGKTAFMLNVVRLNMERFKVNYYSSEMGEQELALRLLGFGYPLNSWKFKAYERGSNFADIIEPDALNIIDFLEISDNFYLIAGELRKIYEKLRNGLAVIAIQKDDKAELGRGKAFSLEKARMYLALDSGKDCNELKIVSGKNWAQRGHNPKGKIIKFKLVDGCRFMAA